MNESAIDLIRSARRRLAEPPAWTRGVDARDSAGRSCLPDSGHAVSWSLAGALIAECPDDDPMEAACYALLSVIDRSPVLGTTGYFGRLMAPMDAWEAASKRSHADVLCALDRAADILALQGAG